MTSTTFLKQYRDTLLELRVMEHQLDISGVTGCPSGATALRYGELLRRTNDSTAASIQQQEGIESAIQALQEKLSHMEAVYGELYRLARNFRERCILRQYYQLCQTDAQVAESLCISTRHANRLRAALLEHLENTSKMSGIVLACPQAS